MFEIDISDFVVAYCTAENSIWATNHESQSFGTIKLGNFTPPHTHLRSASDYE